MVRRFIKSMVIIMVMGGITLPLTTQAQEGGVSQCKFAKDLAMRLGIPFPNTATPEDIFGLLIAEGFVPKDGWQCAKILTVGDFARILVQILERSSGEQLVTAENRGDDNAFIQAAKGAGYNLESVEQTLTTMKNLAEKTGPGADLEMTTTDPTDERQFFGAPDERTGGTDTSIQATFPNRSILDQFVPPAAPPAAPATPPRSGGGSAPVDDAVVDDTLNRLPGTTPRPPPVTDN